MSRRNDWKRSRLYICPKDQHVRTNTCLIRILYAPTRLFDSSDHYYNNDLCNSINLSANEIVQSYRRMQITLSRYINEYIKFYWFHVLHIHETSNTSNTFHSLPSDQSFKQISSYLSGTVYLASIYSKLYFVCHYPQIDTYNNTFNKF